MYVPAQFQIRRKYQPGCEYTRRLFFSLTDTEKLVVKLTAESRMKTLQEYLHDRICDIAETRSDFSGFVSHTDTEPKRHKVTIRFTENEWQKISQFATAMGKSVNKSVREIIFPKG